MNEGSNQSSFVSENWRLLKKKKNRMQGKDEILEKALSRKKSWWI